MSDSAGRLAAALADRYRIERELGQGGMATVYLAHDLKHDRDVALKVLRPELAAAMGPERFHREIQIAAQLQHPNILPLLDSGEAAGFLYYVMPFVQGHSLRERLAKEGELPVPEAARILRDVADALSAAHEKGVVHRDIKPENVLLTGRHALVADFGVAKAVSEATGRQTLTTAGVALGTPTYMAPEQAAASPHIDARADLYALGVMAYEMLTGQPPFSAPSPQALLAAHVTEAPLEVTQRRATIPAPLAQLIMRCLAKKAADRPQTADELLPVLETFTTPSGGTTPTDMRPVDAAGKPRGWRRWAGAAALVVLTLAIVAYALGRYGARTTAGSRQTPLAVDTPSVAVLACSGPGRSEADQYLAEGITQDVIARLSQVGAIRVISGTSILRLLTSDLPVRQVAETLGVRYVLQCSVTRAGDHLRVFGQLVDARTTSVRWAKPFEATTTARYGIHDSIAEQVAGVLTAGGTAIPAVSAASRTSVAAANDAYLEGTYHLHRRSAAAIRAAAAAFRRAIRLDPGFAPAYAALASAYMLSLTYATDLGLSPYELYARGLVLAGKALALDSTLAEAYAARGYMLTKAYGPAEQIRRDFRMALRFGPNSADVHGWWAHFLSREGRHAEALAEAQQAILLDPLAPGRRVGLALDALGAGRPELAEAASQHATALEPGLAAAQRISVAAAVLLDDRATCLAQQPSGALLALCLEGTTRTVEARRIADSVSSALRRPARVANVAVAEGAGELALYYAWRGDVPETIRWLSDAFAASPYGTATDFRLISSRLYAKVRDEAAFVGEYARMRADVWRRTDERRAQLTLSVALEEH